MKFWIPLALCLFLGIILGSVGLSPKDWQLYPIIIIVGIIRAIDLSGAKP